MLHHFLSLGHFFFFFFDLTLCPPLCSHRTPSKTLTHICIGHDRAGLTRSTSSAEIMGPISYDAAFPTLMGSTALIIALHGSYVCTLGPHF